ncbi:P2X purinoceptor 7-like [Hydractinia symbiolongicarpus]|uniref:P2X purinoceptor 7-like n=1 Tax=Hydractinia symbiolongicarpus TaxID=13093 RepID=UPI0025509A6E|nr:P2X purinoceptor 7-like [Hydractinia symbiolongicarpus]
MSSSNKNFTQNPRLCKPVTDWCRCGKCERMPTEKVCVCCVEIDAIKYFNLDDQECITQHPHFNYIVLLKDVLWTALVGLYDRESRGLPERDHVPNRTYRHGAYRQFCSFIHNKLRRGVRRVIPACAVCKIREEYPSVDGRYTGFKGDAEGGELVEMDFSWIAEIEDE